MKKVLRPIGSLGLTTRKQANPCIEIEKALWPDSIAALKPIGVTIWYSRRVDIHFHKGYRNYGGYMVYLGEVLKHHPGSPGDVYYDTDHPQIFLYEKVVD